MVIQDKGVFSPSFMDFSIPSSFAREALLYAPEVGHFFTNTDYRVEISSRPSSLLMFVRSGAFYASNHAQKAIARANNILLIDCRSPHIYGCSEPGDFLWFHIRGSNSKAYTEYLINNFGILFTDKSLKHLEDTFSQILKIARYTLESDAVLAHLIDRTFMTLATATSAEQEISSMLSPALDYIHSHYTEEIDLDLLASLCTISGSHFIRSFKKHLGYTPHEYLLQYRLRQAKHLLQSTDNSIEFIAENCGFNSASHFARAFKNINKITPTEFRKLKF